MASQYILGMVILYAHITGSWTSWVQQTFWKLFNKHNWYLSHASIYAGLNIDLDRHIEIEANIQVDQTTFRYNPDKMMVYFPYCNRSSVERALTKTIDECEETLYGWIGWFAIAFRTLMEWMLPEKYAKRVKGWNIFWGWGIFCSEYVHVYWSNLIKDILQNTKNVQERLYWTEFGNELAKYNPNVFTPLDIDNLQRKHSWCFRKFE